MTIHTSSGESNLATEPRDEWRLPLAQLDQLLWHADTPVALVLRTQRDLERFIDLRLTPLLKGRRRTHQYVVGSVGRSKSAQTAIADALNEFYGEIIDHDPSLWSEIIRQREIENEDFEKKVLVIRDFGKVAKSSLEEKSTISRIINDLCQDTNLSILICLDHKGADRFVNVPGFQFLSSQGGHVQKAAADWVPTRVQELDEIDLEEGKALADQGKRFSCATTISGFLAMLLIFGMIKMLTSPQETAFAFLDRAYGKEEIRKVDPNRFGDVFSKMELAANAGDQFVPLVPDELIEKQRLGKSVLEDINPTPGVLVASNESFPSLNLKTGTEVPVAKPEPTDYPQRRQFREMRTISRNTDYQLADLEVGNYGANSGNVILDPVPVSLSSAIDTYDSFNYSEQPSRSYSNGYPLPEEKIEHIDFPELSKLPFFSQAEIWVEPCFKDKLEPEAELTMVEDEQTPLLIKEPSDSILTLEDFIYFLSESEETDIAKGFESFSKLNSHKKIDPAVKIWVAAKTSSR